VAENGDPFDDDLHGTHCAGIIRAKGNKGVGVTGVCWAAKIMALKFIGIDGYGYIDDAITCIGYALAMKAKNSYPCMVLSNSWGSYWKSQAPYDAFKATQLAGVLVVAAAGNDGLDNDNIISVGATDNADKRADFGSGYSSNYGFGNVDLFAPGKDILSTVPHGVMYYKASGTSISTFVLFL